MRRQKVFSITVYAKKLFRSSYVEKAPQEYENGNTFAMLIIRQLCSLNRSADTFEEASKDKYLKTVFLVSVWTLEFRYFDHRNWCLINLNFIIFSKGYRPLWSEPFL